MNQARIRNKALFLGAAVGALAIANSAWADQIDVGNPDWAIRWDNTVKYSNAFRLLKPDATVSGNAQPSNSNTNDGDLNFGRGLVSNRVDELSEFDAIFQEHTGMRVSAAFWYDTVYNDTTANHNALTTNNASVGPNYFPSATVVMNGKNAEILDAMVFHTFELPSDQTLNVRVGRFSQLYGETLFMGANGIAAAQATTDVIKATSVPNSQFKEIMLPVGQVSLNWEAGHGIMVGAYYQFEYRKDRLPGVGSFFSDADIFGPGVETIWAPGSLPNGTAFSKDIFYTHANDLNPKSQGQAGGEIRWKAGKNWEFGLYAANYHEKDPAAGYLVGSGGVPAATTFADGTTGHMAGLYEEVYNQNVQTYGTSFATAWGDTNISGEFSARHNQSLDTSDSAGGNGGIVFASNYNNNTNNTRYLRGDTLHANLSAISLFTENGIWDGASLVTELGANHLVDIINKHDTTTVSGPGGTTFTNSGLYLNPTSTHTAVAFRGVFEPSFFQVIPNVDITTPLGFGYGIYGRSAMGSHIGNFNPESVADISFGVKATYNEVWKAALNYTTFLGPKGQATAGGSARYTSYQQDMYDRDFVSFSLTRTF